MFDRDIIMWIIFLIIFFIGTYLGEKVAFSIINPTWCSNIFTAKFPYKNELYNIINSFIIFFIVFIISIIFIAVPFQIVVLLLDTHHIMPYISRIIGFRSNELLEFISLFITTFVTGIIYIYILDDYWKKSKKQSKSSSN